MTLLNVYTTLPNFPRFGSVDILFASSDPYSPGVLNPDVDLSTFDYEIVEGINVARYPMQLFRPPAIDLWLDVGGALNSTTIPEEVYGNFHVYKALPYPSKPLLHGGEWLPESSFIESNFDAATWALLYSQREVPQSGEWLIDWDVYQHYRDNNYFEEPTVEEGQGVQAFKVSVRYPANYGIGNNPLITVNYSNPGSLYPYQDYLDFFDGNWDWEWKYIDFCEVIPRTPFPNFTPTAQGLGYYEMRTFPTVVRVKAINYINLLSGYPNDPRTILDEPIVTPTTTETCEIGYYRENKLESIPGLRSIDWMRYTVDLIANTPIKLPIVDCTLGTLKVSSTSLETAIIGTQVANTKYPTKYYFEDYLEELFLAWNDTLAIPTPTSTFRILGANNNVWNNRSSATQDVNFDITHPMFAIDSQRADDWHIAPQSNNGIGTLIMDSPRTIEIHTALNAGQYLTESPAIIGTGTAEEPETPALHKLDWYIKNGSISDKITAIWKTLEAWKYSKNDLDPDKARVTNLGYLIENIARVLGIRLDSNGEINRDKERQHYTRSIVNNPTYDPRAYSTNCFGKYGRLTPHLSNSNGREAWDKFADIPQMLEALAEHQNRSLGIQQGTELKLINATTGKTDYYPNQLSILIDMMAKLQEIQLNSKESLNLISVIAYELREMWAGIGIPMLYRKIFTRYGAIRSVAFQKDKGSINTSLTTLKINLGMVLGSFIARPNDKRNPLERLFFKPDEKK